MLPQERLDLRLLLGLRLLRHGQVMEGDAVGLDLGGEVGVVGDHQGNLGVQLARLPPPEQVDQAMPLLRDQDRHPLGPVGEADPPVHPVLARQRGERGIELVAAQAETLALDLHPHEERAVGAVAHMLVGAQDVPVVQGDEAGDRGDHAPVVGAVDQETDVVAHVKSGYLLDATLSVCSHDDRHCTGESDLRGRPTGDLIPGGRIMRHRSGMLSRAISSSLLSVAAAAMSAPAQEAKDKALADLAGDWAGLLHQRLDPALRDRHSRAVVTFTSQQETRNGRISRKSEALLLDVRGRSQGRAVDDGHGRPPVHRALPAAGRPGGEEARDHGDRGPPEDSCFPN